MSRPSVPSGLIVARNHQIVERAGIYQRAEPQVMNKTVVATGRVRAGTPLLSLLSLGAGRMV